LPVDLCNSQVMLLDEPTEGIQPSIVQEIDETLRRINREKGVTLLVVEQKIDFARHLAQKFIMEKGSLLLMERLNLTDSSASIFGCLSPDGGFLGWKVKKSAQPCIEISRIWSAWLMAGHFFRVLLE